MLHSLRFRLIVVTAVFPMLTIAAAGLLIRTANADTFRAAPSFSVAALGPGEFGGAAGQITVGEGGTGVVTSVVGTSESAPVAGTCPSSLETFVMNLPEDVRSFTGSAVPLVYSASGSGDFVVAARPQFVQAYRAEQASSLSALNLKVAAVIAAAGIACGSVGFVASQRILKPVHALTSAARRLESGDLDQRVGYSGKDEIGQLSHAFDAMAISLQRTEALRKTMTSDVAHELRTPLNNISGFVDMLSDGLVEPDARVFATLQEETQLLVRLVDDLEQLSLGDAGQLKLDRTQASLGEIVERSGSAMAARAAERGVALAVTAEATPEMELDVSRIDQVMRNLLENAIRHTPEGGMVTVLCEQRDNDAVVTVEDSGPGIEPEHLPFIFERFYRVDTSRTRRTGGSGLGLAIARQIVEAHGGRISAENRAEGGARFTFELPLAGEEPA